MNFPTPRNRAYRTFMYLPTDRVLDCEFGFWSQTLRRWAHEGFPPDLAEAIGEAHFDSRFDEWIGCDRDEGGAGVPFKIAMNPPFEFEILAEDELTRTTREPDGSVARRWKPGIQEVSIPHYLEFPVKDRPTWEAFKERYRLDDPTRTVTPEEIDRMRQAAADGWMVGGFASAFYGILRGWVGMENLSYLFYDDPALCHDMIEHWTNLLLHTLRQIPTDVPIHQMGWWEDMAYKAGPLVSPRTLDEFMVPAYQAVMDELRRHGCTLAWVDCDGLIHDLVPGWLKTGVNIMFPCEVAAGTDMYLLRSQYGKELRFQGGIDKRALARGRDAIDRELERIKPLLDDGGFVPHLDHLVPPDISLSDYMYYREEKMKLIGKK